MLVTINFINQLKVQTLVNSFKFFRKWVKIFKHGPYTMKWDEFFSSVTFSKNYTGLQRN